LLRDPNIDGVDKRVKALRRRAVKRLIRFYAARACFQVSSRLAMLGQWLVSKRQREPRVSEPCQDKLLRRKSGAHPLSAFFHAAGRPASE